MNMHWMISSQQCTLKKVRSKRSYKVLWYQYTKVWRLSRKTTISLRKLLKLMMVTEQWKKDHTWQKWASGKNRVFRRFTQQKRPKCGAFLEYVSFQKKFYHLKEQIKRSLIRANRRVSTIDATFFSCLGVFQGSFPADSDEKFFDVFWKQFRLFSKFF